jgi:hypothetical protein
MRARAREVQIFNMSLIDILCGALGAFCFMMLVLLPYYKSPGGASDLHQQQMQTDQLMRDMDNLRQAQAVNDPAFGQKMSDMMRKLEDQIKQMQGEINQTSAENQQLKTEKDELQKKNDEQKRALDARNPFFVYVAADDSSQALDLYVRDDLVQGGKRNPPFNPAGPHQGRFWTGDIDLNVPGRGISLWAVRDSPANVHYKIYIKLANDAPRRQATGIFAGVYGGSYTINIPDLRLTPERYWTLAGTLTADPQGNGTVSFQAANDAERDAEWKALTNTAPPPQPSAVVSQTPHQTGPGGMAPAERRALLERLQKMEQQRKQQQQSQGATAAPSP